MQPTARLTSVFELPLKQLRNDYIASMQTTLLHFKPIIFGFYTSFHGILPFIIQLLILDVFVAEKPAGLHF